MQRYKNLVVLLLVLLIIILGGSILYKKIQNDGNTREKVKITNADLTAENPAQKVPANFPKDIPVQLTEVIESYDLEYPERGVIVSGITFKTFRTPADLFESYKGYLVQAGYVVDERNMNQDSGVLYFTKENNVLGVIINPLNEVDGKRAVQLVYTKNNI